MNLPYDVIYKIFFCICDFETVDKFWFLNKEFTQMYLARHNSSYVHRFNIEFDALFSCLQSLKYASLDHVQLIRSPITSDTTRYSFYNLFSLFKRYFTKEVVVCCLPCCENIAYLVLSQGPLFIKRYSKAIVNGNKVRITNTCTDYTDAIDLNNNMLFTNEVVSKVKAIENYLSQDN